MKRWILGLDSSKYRTQISKPVEADIIGSQTHDYSEYGHCDPFIFICPYASCKKKIIVRDISVEKVK